MSSPDPQINPRMTRPGTAQLSTDEKRRLLATLLRKRAEETVVTAPVTIGQKALAYLNRAYPDNRAYNALFVLRISGTMDEAALRTSLQRIVDRHAILRTTYVLQDGEFVQRIHGARDVDFEVVDASGASDGALEARWLADATQPYDLASDAPLRVRVYTRTNSDPVLVIGVHHIAFDYWSFDVFMRELQASYAAAIDNKPAPLKPLTAQFADRARMQNEVLASPRGEELWQYWKRELAGEIAALELPLDGVRSESRTAAGATVTEALPVELVERLRALAKARRTTLYAVVLGAVQVLLQRYTAQDDIVIGSPMACRDSAATEDLIGYFANVVPLRANLSGDPTFEAVLEQVNRTVVGALEHQGFPFALLVERLGVKHDTRRNPIFDVVFAWETSHIRGNDSAGERLKAELVYARQLGAPYDLSVFGFESERGLSISFQYDEQLFAHDTMERMLSQLRTLLAGIADDPGQKIATLSLLTEAERRQIDQWNATASEYPRDRTIQQLFEEVVQQYPNAIAVQFGAKSLTYRELNARANQLADYLRDTGVRRGSFVALCVDRSLEMVVGILAILKAGAAYVPLEPSYPAERLSFMLHDTQVGLLLTQQPLLAKLTGATAQVVCIDDESTFTPRCAENRPAGSGAEDVAYVMYTSGSTGTPKGVCVPHRAVVRLVRNTNYAEFSSNEVFLQFAPISFDAATLEIWGPLLNGGKLAIYPNQPLALDDLGRCIREQGVTTLWLTSGLFQLMVETRVEDLRGVRQLLAGGDVLSVPHVEKVRRELPGCRFINGYGPTENTTFSCCYTVPESGPIMGSIPIGRPIANSQAHILDGNMQRVPVGVAGELYVGGDGLATGYWNRPELTAERFVPDPFSSRTGARLYRTGDVARYLRDGNIEFLGRTDDQVKIRGYRVEPRAVESLLNRHDGVLNSAVVVDRPAGSAKRLVAYVACKATQTSAAELRNYLAAVVPEYMIPAAFVMLDELPLSPNGKVDRRRLKPLCEVIEQQSDSFVRPESDLEQTIASIWQDALGLDRVGRYDNFFDLGGHSLLLAKVHEEMQRETGKSFTIVDIFRYPTVSSIASYLGKAGEEERSFHEVRERARQQRLAKSRRVAMAAARSRIHEQS